MVTKCYQVYKTAHALEVIANTCAAMPCFIDCRDVSANIMEVSFRVREADAAALERRIMEIV